MNEKKCEINLYIVDKNGKYNRIYTSEEVIKNLQNELDKYKSLYQNEKDKNDTLKRIIKKVEEYIENTDCVTWDNQAHEDILDLLKEIK